MRAMLATKPQPRKFVPPPAPGRPAAAPVALPDAPKVAYADGGAHSPAISDATAAALRTKPKPRAFVPPSPSGSAGGPAPLAILEAPSPGTGGMPSANVNVAVVGLAPASTLGGPLPDASRDAKFSAGPAANGAAGGAAPASGSALSVPGLLVRGGAPQDPARANPLLMAQMAPTSSAMLEAAAKTAQAARTPDPPAAEIRLTPPPDPQFSGRDVYTLAVQMPNISSYQGSWIMWFAERTSFTRGAGGLRPPVPVHKVDPKYLPAVIAERVEGKVQLAGVIRINGRVDLLRVLKGVDPRLDHSAEEALRKWEFEPAERNGAPVEVDVVAEIPFLLAPQVKK
jgi:TonB family protein